MFEVEFFAKHVQEDPYAEEADNPNDIAQPDRPFLTNC